MKDIAIIGAGGYGRETACLLKAINEVKSIWNFIGFFDDGVLESNKYGSILGGLDTLNNWESDLAIVIAIANPQTRMKIHQKLNNPMITYPNIIAPDVIFFDTDSIISGIGNIVGFKSVISCNIVLGNFNSFNSNVFIGHDCIIGNYNMFNPSVRISGEVRIGDRNFFGVSSIVLQQKRIGNDTIIAANSVIITKTRDNTTYIGNPAKKFEY